MHQHVTKHMAFSTYICIFKMSHLNSKCSCSIMFNYSWLSAVCLSPQWNTQSWNYQQHESMQCIWVSEYWVPDRTLNFPSLILLGLLPAVSHWLEHSISNLSVTLMMASWHHCPEQLLLIVHDRGIINYFEWFFIEIDFPALCQNYKWRFKDSK